jgi:hypothetical protein
MLFKKKTKKPSKEKKEMKKGDEWVSGECGLAVIVDEVCGCVDVCDLTCCGKEMQPKG